MRCCVRPAAGFRDLPHLAEDSDIISIHDDFYGVPWEAFTAAAVHGEPLRPPAWWVKVGPPAVFFTLTSWPLSPNAMVQLARQTPLRQHSCVCLPPYLCGLLSLAREGCHVDSGTAYQ